jgi:hypothetical protein
MLYHARDASRPRGRARAPLLIFLHLIENKVDAFLLVLFQPPKAAPYFVVTYAKFCTKFSR